MIPGDLLSACPHRQFYTLPGLLDSWAALPNSNPNACMLMQGGSLYHFYDGLWYDPAERRTHDLPCERRTRYRLSQPDTVFGIEVETLVGEMRLPQDKLNTLIELLNQAVKSNKMTVRSFQSLLGHLNFACLVVVPGRAFMKRLYNLLCKMKNPKPHYFIRLTKEA